MCEHLSNVEAKAKERVEVEAEAEAKEEEKEEEKEDTTPMPRPDIGVDKIRRRRRERDGVKDSSILGWSNSRSRSGYDSELASSYACTGESADTTISPYS